MINWLFTYLSLVVLLFLSYAYGQKEFHSSNLFAFLAVVYFMYAMIFSFLFPARILKIVEKDGNVEYGESLGTFLLMIIMPLNTLFIHNRVLAALKKPIVR